jgi:hypothetical protein
MRCMTAGAARSGQTLAMATIEEREGKAWGEPPADASRLVRRCHELRTQPIAELSIEDLRLLIGQGIGLEWLVPVALDLLEDDPLAAGDLYEGDLITSVLGVPESYWAGATDEWLRLRDQAEGLVTLERVIEHAKRFLEHSRGGA